MRNYFFNDFIFPNRDVDFRNLFFDKEYLSHEKESPHIVERQIPPDSIERAYVSGIMNTTKIITPRFLM